MYTTLISTDELSQHLDDPNWVIIDARFVLAQPQRGEENYQVSHIPGAIYAHLERDLSNTIIPGVTGRHPWPTPKQAAAYFGGLGIGPEMQVVAYDDAGGALAAVRVWWMLRWLGHDAVAVLDGGWQKWVQEGRPVNQEAKPRPPVVLTPRLRPELLADLSLVEAARQHPGWRVIDGRAAERYRGEMEPIDAIAGHIPGALNAPYLDNLDERGCFKSPQELRAIYQPLIGETPPDRVIFYCGSGVTSIHGLLAMMLAGLGEGKVYGGSWSEWITDPRRPIAR